VKAKEKTPKPESLRERKKADVRNTLVGTAVALFLKKGFDAVTVDEIVEKANVSRSTFFRYFPTKEAIVFRHHARRLATFRSFLEKRHDAGSPVLGLQRAFDEMAALVATRTTELAAFRKGQMRTLLDHVAQGFFTIGADGADEAVLASSAVTVTGGASGVTGAARPSGICSVTSVDGVSASLGAVGVCSEAAAMGSSS
jgi:AcrR family transcriptional regulator